MDFLKCVITIHQNTKGLTDGDVTYIVNVERMRLYQRSYSQVGTFPNCVQCYTLGCEPTGLLIVPFITNDDDKSIHEFIIEVNEFLLDSNRKEFEKEFIINSINARQTIKITKEDF